MIRIRLRANGFPLARQLHDPALAISTPWRERIMSSSRHWVPIVVLSLLVAEMSSAASLGSRLARDFQSPWRQENLMTLGAGAGLSFLAMRTENTDAEAAYLEKSWLEGPVDVGDLFGSGEVELGGTAAILALGAVTGSDQLHDLGLDLASGIAVASTYVWIMKPLVHRTRPNGGPFSFPSGHTALAFTTAGIIDRHAGWEVSTLAYLLAAGTAAGRVEDRRHHTSDVIFGAALGLAVAGVHPVASALGWPGRHVAPQPGGVVVHGTF
jgi:membrane-associated phospholipid phosphatase